MLLLIFPIYFWPIVLSSILKQVLGQKQAHLIVNFHDLYLKMNFKQRWKALSLCIVVQVSPKCAAHVQRVMHQRAVDVHLMPEIQTACVQDLAKHCSDQLGKGEVIDL